MGALFHNLFLVLMKNETINLNHYKRLFFGMEVSAPWPENLPSGRLLDEKHRHLTLAFLGNINAPSLLDKIDQAPKPPFEIGLTGAFAACEFLPRKHPRVVAWSLNFHDNSGLLLHYQQALVDWLKVLHFPMDEREWLPHVTLCRAPFESLLWEKAFEPLPFHTQSIHLYESLGNLVYQPIWTHSLQPPFVEFDHTADMAFLVRGQSIQDLYPHAFAALAFKFPELTPFYQADINVKGIEELVSSLNRIVSSADCEIGSPFKAVSYHGQIKQNKNGIYEWEMIVDV